MNINTPNPGSLDARRRGCTCPVYDNHYGVGYGTDEHGKPTFWLSADCPVHHAGTAKGEAAPRDPATIDLFGGTNA